MIASKKQISDRMVVRILLRHKEKMIADRMEDDRLQRAINRVIARFAKKTGRKITGVDVQQIDGKFELKIEMEC